MSDLVLQQAPPPLEALRREIIHPDNIAREQRVRRAQILSVKGVFNLRQRRSRLARQLKRTGYYQMVAELEYLREQCNAYREAKNRAGLLSTRVKLHSLRARLDPLIPVAREHKRLEQMIEAYTIAKQRKAAEETMFKELAQEARIYSHYIKTTWSNLPGCHHRFLDKKGKTVVEVPQFARCDITPDAVFFKILASYKGLFGWKPGLPYGVFVDNLIDERTLANISIACQRQATAVTTHHGVWIVIHRLNSVDGLMDRLKYSQVMEYYPGYIQNDYPVCVGVGGNRTLKWINFRDFPHWLIAGWTGGGKSNLVNVIICTLISRHEPKDLRLVLIDLKGGLEFSHYEGLPHLAGPIIQSTGQVANTVAQLESEMGRRFDLMRGYRAKHIEVYNRRVSEDKKLPRVILFFDEFATLASQGDLTKRIMASVMQLVNKGRAVGIHIVISTQDPRTDIIPGVIKTNLNVRISGRMPTPSASVTVLGRGDAANLASIPGRMLMMIGPDPEPIQTPLITDDDIEAALNTARKHPAPPPLELPEGTKHQQWTPERVIELALKHLNGNVSHRPVYQAIDEITLSQARDLCESVWEMDQIVYDGREYRVVKRRGGARYLVPVEEQHERGA